jgi:hypothetical protein
MFIIQHITPSYVVFAIHDNVPQLTNDDSLALEFETLEAEIAVSEMGGDWIIIEKDNQNID